MSAPSAPPSVVHVLYGETMGTRWRVDLCAARDLPLDTLHARLQARLDAIVAQMSSWEPGSDLQRYNRAAAGSWQVLPADFFAVMRCALRIAAASGGAFDPTLGALVAAWGFGAEASAVLPRDAAALQPARDAAGWHRLVLREDTRELLQPGGVTLDLSAIAKGYAVDALVDVLRAQGIAAALVDVGGELRGHGRKPGGDAWRVLVETGDEDEGGDGEACILALEDVAVATSGTHWHRHAHAGRQLAHTLDPRLGRPVEEAARAVSVLAATAIEADAWSTALTVMGVDEGLAFAVEHGLAARFVPDGADQAPRCTPAFTARTCA